MTHRRVPTWPVYLLALPAAVSIWAGWVGLGQLTGFGKVQLLPGIWDSLELNTAITLPIGMEAYAAYALRVWLAAGVPTRAREFARTSAIAAFALGALGQIAFHLMQAAGTTAAPWPVTTVVSCLPVGVLALGATLAHLLNEGYDEQDRQRDATRKAATAVPAASPPPQPRLRPGGFPSVAPTPVQPSPAPVVPNRPAFTPAVQSPDRPPERSSTASAERPEAPASERPADRLAERSPDRADDAPPERPARRSTERPRASNRIGPARKRTGKRRTDAQLSQAVRQLAEQNGGTPPSTYRVKQALGVGSGRAARLLAELDPTPAGPPAKNGAATRKDGTA